MTGDDDLLRKIYFYRIAHWSDIKPYLSRDLQRIENLPWENDGRYLADGEGSRLALWPERFEFPIRLKFGKTRMGNLPLKELSGRLEQLDLAAEQGLVELCHVVIYDDGHAAAEFNFSGPRIRRLSDYLFAKRNELKEQVIFRNLFQRDVISLVEKMSAITWLEIAGQPSAAALLSEADRRLGGALDSLGQVGADKLVRLNLGTDRGHNSRLQKLSVLLAQLVHRNRGEANEHLKTLKVRGVNSRGAVDAVDLLEQHLVSYKPIERLNPESRALSSDSAYRQIDAAYEELRDILIEAAVGQELFQ